MDNFNELLHVYNDWSKFPFDGKSPCNIFHYTSLEGLNGILTTGALFATDIYRLNDLSESTYTLSLIKDNISSFSFSDIIESAIIEEIDRRLPLLKEATATNYFDFTHSTNESKNGSINDILSNRLFLTSFSMSPDSLPMWLYYANKDNSNSGINISFDALKLLSKPEKVTTENKLEKLDIHYGKVIYSKKKQIKLLNTITKDFLKYKIESSDADFGSYIDLFISKCYFVGAFFKDKCFKSEDEFRIAAFTRTSEDAKSVLSLPKEESTPKPHINIYFDKKAINGIKLGPGNPIRPDIISQYPNIKDNFSVSGIPFRNR